MARTISPNVSAMPAWPITPALSWLMMMAPVPAKIRAKVPSSSASSFFMSAAARGSAAEVNSGLGPGDKAAKLRRQALRMHVRECPHHRLRVFFEARDAVLREHLVFVLN